MKYDDASWHYEGNFPSTLPIEHGATHIAIFFAWAAENDLLSSFHTEDHAVELKEMMERKLNYRDYFIEYCDGKLTADDLNDTGRRFATIYYEDGYYSDYQSVFEGGGDTIYHTMPTWDNYSRMKGIIQARFIEWLNS